jgi:hypothetical protein
LKKGNNGTAMTQPSIRFLVPASKVTPTKQNPLIASNDLDHPLVPLNMLVLVPTPAVTPTTVLINLMMTYLN